MPTIMSTVVFLDIVALLSNGRYQYIDARGVT